ncbi:MAG TPA: hypothetical protein VFQ43_15000, partial [Nitrososphaera sp.]|nr:hypothetical protein [Nitrososphaera sp.]
PGPLPYIAAEGGGTDRWFDPAVGTVNNALSLVGNPGRTDCEEAGIRSRFLHAQHKHKKGRRA